MKNPNAKQYRCSSPFTLGITIVHPITGNTLLKASLHIPVFPHIHPKAAKRNPESPIVGSLTCIGRKLASMATANDSTTAILFLMLQSTIRFTPR